MSPLERDRARGPHVNLQAETEVLTDLIHHPPLLATDIKPCDSSSQASLDSQLSSQSHMSIYQHTLYNLDTTSNKLHT